LTATHNPGGLGYQLLFAQMPEGQVTISFAPSPRELWRARLGLTLHDPKQLITYSCFPIVLGAVMAAVLGYDALTAIELILAYLGVVWFVLVFGAYLTNARSKSACQPRTMTFGDAGVTIQSIDGESKLNWQAFASFRSRSSGHTIKMARERGFYWIPTRAFSSEWDEAMFVTMAASHIGR
jgi:membrane-associated phospholipid phosphatase